MVAYHVEGRDLALRAVVSQEVVQIVHNWKQDESGRDCMSQ